MAGKFEIYQGTDGFRWRLRAVNGQVVAQGEGYSSKAAAIEGTAAVQRAAQGAETAEVTE